MCVPVLVQQMLDEAASVVAMEAVRYRDELKENQAVAASVRPHMHMHYVYAHIPIWPASMCV